MAAPTPVVDAKPVTAIVAPKVQATECQVAVRLLDGSVENKTFAASAPVSEVYSWVSSFKGVPRGFKLGTTFPRATFDNPKSTLNDIGTSFPSLCVIDVVVIPHFFVLFSPCESLV